MRARLDWHSTRLQLFVTHLFAILAPLAALGIFLALYLPARYTDQVGRQLRAEARLARPFVEEQLRAGVTPADLELRIRALATETHLRFTVIDRTGRVLAESDRDPALLENHAARPEFRAALRGGEGEAVRRSATLGIDMLYVALLMPPQQVVLRLATPLRELEMVKETIRRTLAAAVLLAGLMALALAAGLGRLLTNPLHNLQERVDQLAAGDLGVRVQPEGSAETRRLGQAFNTMAKRLQGMVRREAEDRSRYETILTQMADGIVITDPEGQVEMFNRAAGRLLNVAPQRTIGRSLLEGTGHAGLWQLLERSLGQRTAETEEIRLEEDGAVLRVHAAPVLGVGGWLAGGVLVLQDLTEARRLEEMRRDFVANVSHELKSPVAAVRALAETLVLRGHNRPELAADYAARINHEAERMSLLIADLLDLAAIEAGRRVWKPERAAAAALLQDVEARFEEPAAERGTRLEGDCPPELAVWADVGAVEQTLANLVDNAIRYSPAGARVSMTAAAHDGEIVFTVADTGPGIPRDALPRVFERFYRIDRGRSRREGGTGLGLAIARHLVESQGGRIWVDSGPGGSRFSFTIPAAL